jgi:hypothetical protein
VNWTIAEQVDVFLILTLVFKFPKKGRAHVVWLLSNYIVT